MILSVLVSSRVRVCACCRRRLPVQQLPRADRFQKDDFISQQLFDVQSAARRVPGVLACVLCWDAK